MPNSGRWGGCPPHRRYRTGHETFASRAAELLSIRAVVTPHLRWVQVSAPQPSNLPITAAWRVPFQSRTFVERSVFTTSGTCATLAPAASAGVRPLLIEYPGLPVHPAHVSISFGFPEGVGFLGHLSRLGLWSVAYSISGERQTGYSVPRIHSPALHRTQCGASVARR